MEPWKTTLIDEILMEHVAGDSGWLRDNPEIDQKAPAAESPHGYFLWAWNSNAAVQEIPVTEEEYRELKAQLALMRIRTRLVNKWRDRFASTD
jgi:hypothetical protein